MTTRHLVDTELLSPAYIMVCALDLFVDQCLDCAGRLVRAGVPVELIVYPGFRMAKDAAVTKRAGVDSLSALHRAFSR